MKRKANRVVPTIAKSPRSNIKIPAQNDDGFGTSVPPSIVSIAIYFDQKGVPEIARDFYNENELREWKNATGQPVTNWKVCAADWIYDYRQELKKRLRQSPFYSESF